MVLRLALDTKHPKMQRNDQGLKAHIASTKLTNNHRTIIDDLIGLVKKALAKSAFFMPLTFPRRGRRLLRSNKHSRSLCILFDF